jgi:adenosine deaminase
VSAFTDALEAGDLTAIRACPKADLHAHAAGSGNRGYIRERTGKDIAPVAAPLRSMDEMHAWFGANIGDDLFKGVAGSTLALEASFAQAKADGVTRIELGYDCWIITQGFASADDVAQRQKAVHEATAPDVAWVRQVSMSRHCSFRALDLWLSPFLELGFYQTLDLSGDELIQPIEKFVPLYRKAKTAGLRLKAHVGEWGTADDVRRAVELLDLHEVNHGIAAADDPAVMRFLADNRIRLNICPTSNLMLGRVESLAEHPIRKLFDAGVDVTIGSDDVLVFGSSVSQEYLALHRAGLMTAPELDGIRLNGLADRQRAGP